MDIEDLNEDIILTDEEDDEEEDIELQGLIDDKDVDIKENEMIKNRILAEKDINILKKQLKKTKDTAKKNLLREEIKQIKIYIQELDSDLGELKDPFDKLMDQLEIDPYCKKYEILLKMLRKQKKEIKTTK